MPTSSLSSSSAIVVELAGFRSADKSSSATTASRAFGAAVSSKRLHADLLSMRRSLNYQASVEIDKFDAICEEYGEAYGVALVKQIRALLNKEFGKLRVHRYRRLYVIRHRSVEGLISSLLRVQFYAHQLELPVVKNQGEPPAGKLITLTWGVGRTNSEAEVERLRRRKQKFRR